MSSTTKVRKKHGNGKRKGDVHQMTSFPFNDVTFQNSGNVNTNDARQAAPGMQCPVTVIVPKPCSESHSNGDGLSRRGVALQDVSNDVDVFKPVSVIDSSTVDIGSVDRTSGDQRIGILASPAVITPETVLMDKYNKNVDLAEGNPSEEELCNSEVKVKEEPSPKDEVSVEQSGDICGIVTDSVASVEGDNLIRTDCRATMTRIFGSDDLLSCGDKDVTVTSFPYSKMTLEGVLQNEEKSIDEGVLEKEEPMSQDDGEIARKEEPDSDDDDYEIVQNVESMSDEEGGVERSEVVEGWTVHPSSTISPSSVDDGEMVEEEWMPDKDTNDDLIQQYLEISNQPQDVFVASTRSGRRRKLINYAAMDMNLDEGVAQTQGTAQHIAAGDLDSDFELTDSDDDYTENWTRRKPRKPRVQTDKGARVQQDKDETHAPRKTSKPRKRLCPYCGVMINNLKAHIRHVHEKVRRHRCGYCEYRTNCKASLDAHIATKHDPSKLIVCEYCGKRFTKMNYNNHVKHAHYKSKNYACKICGKKFPSIHYTTRHERRVHVNNRDYASCTVCGKMIKHVKSGWNLKMHMAIHSGDRHYNCHLCDYKCIQLNALNWHMKSRHLISKKAKESDDQQWTFLA